MTTVREIADFAGVSISTVSLVLNEKPGVSDSMRQVVMDAKSELETRRVLSAREDDAPTNGARNMKMLSLMVLHPPILRSSEVFSDVLQGIQTAAEQSNIQLRLVMNDPQATENHVAHIYLADDNLRPDGVLVFGAQKHEPLIEVIAERGIPCVVLGREATKYAVSGIERDEMKHAYALTQHLIELGHRKIAFVGGDDRYDFTVNRRTGYQQALQDAEIVPDEAWCVLGDGADATSHILTHCADVTALVFVNDSYAAEGLDVIAEHGRVIPDTLSVASFDDTSIAQLHQPAFTSIAYNRATEGQWAVKMLLDQIRFPYVSRVHYVFDAELIVRESTAPPVQIVQKVEKD
ncbi:MAG: LacI family DNA-binding transcriptional regulator [Chloroflexota bacterium]